MKIVIESNPDNIIDELINIYSLKESKAGCLRLYKYSKTPIYRGVWGKGNIRGKSGFAVNRGFVCLHYTC